MVLKEAEDEDEEDVNEEAVSIALSFVITMV